MILETDNFFIQDEVSLLLRRGLKHAIERQPADALLLSGGVDSSILAALDPETPCITVVLQGQGKDLQRAQQVSESIGASWYGIEITEEDALQALDEIIQLTGSYDPALLNDIPVYIGLKYAASLGFQTIRTEDFADTLFAGYEYLWEIEDLKKYLNNLLPHVSLASSKVAKKMGIRTVYPYLDQEVIDIGLNLVQEKNTITVDTDRPGDFVQEKNDTPTVIKPRTWSKIFLRKAALGILPTQIAFRTKTDLEFGSGMYTLEQLLEESIPDDVYKTYLDQGYLFWNKMHAALFMRYKKFGFSPEEPTDYENNYACMWCHGGIEKGRHHCVTCGAYPADILPLK